MAHQFCSYGASLPRATVLARLGEIQSLFKAIDFFPTSIFIGKNNESGGSERKIKLGDLPKHLESIEFVGAYDRSNNEASRFFAQKISVSIKGNRIEAHLILSHQRHKISSPKGRIFLEYWHKQEPFYGFARTEMFKNPELYPLGLGDPSDTKLEIDRGTIWFVDHRDHQSYLTNTVRDIFAYNFIPRTHLDLDIGQGETLSSWIASGPGRGRVEPFSEHVAAWIIDPKALPLVRESLKDSNFLVHNFYDH